MTRLQDLNCWQLYFRSKLCYDKWKSVKTEWQIYKSEEKCSTWDAPDHSTRRYRFFAIDAPSNPALSGHSSLANLIHSLFSPGIKLDRDLITVDLMFWMFMLSSPHCLRDSRFQASDVAAEQKHDKSHDMTSSYVVLIYFLLCLGTTDGEFRHASGDKQDRASQPPISRLLDNHEIFAEKKQNLLLLTDHL